MKISGIIIQNRNISLYNEYDFVATYKDFCTMRDAIYYALIGANLIKKFFLHETNY